MADAPPRLFVALTSIIGVSGMPGNAWYAFANESLELLLRRFAAEHDELVVTDGGPPREADAAPADRGRVRSEVDPQLRRHRCAEEVAAGDVGQERAVVGEGSPLQGDAIIGVGCAGRAHERSHQRSDTGNSSHCPALASPVSPAPATDVAQSIIPYAVRLRPPAQHRPYG